MNRKATRKNVPDRVAKNAAPEDSEREEIEKTQRQAQCEALCAYKVEIITKPPEHIAMHQAKNEADGEEEKWHAV